MQTLSTSIATLRPGCYIDESAGSSDMLNERIVDFAKLYGFQCDPLESPEDEDDMDACNDYSEALNECADDAVSFLNDQENRPYCHWTVDDNSLFLSVNVDDARDACDFVSTREQDCPDDDYLGEWLHVSDHGNATLYVRSEDGTDKEIWGVV